MKVGYVAIVGRPNVGKSTILNACIGESLAPVSQVPNTTRHTLLGIYTDEVSQIMFIDTPGFQMHDDLMGQRLRKEAQNSLKQADVILRVRDVSRPLGEEDAHIDKQIQHLGIPIIEIYTKLDLRHAMDIPKEGILIRKDKIPVAQICEAILPYLPEGELLYDADDYTNTPVYDRVGEIIRERANLLLKEEIPHALYVHVEDVEVQDHQVRILAYIVVERESQKRIVIGK
jgi:GTP-binding protein Era